MKEDIINGYYNDPFQLDPLAESNVEDYGFAIQDLANTSLKESYYNKYFRKKRNNQESEDENDLATDEKVENRRHLRKVNIGSEPWDGDQSLVWPDYEAEAFENALEQFRQRPESNTGYLNKKLNQIMRQRWGQSDVDKCIGNTLFPKKVKESARKRFQRKIQEKLFDDEGDNPEYIIEIKNKDTGKWEHVGSELKNGKVIPSTSSHSTLKVFKTEKAAEYSNLFDQLLKQGYKVGVNLRVSNKN